MISKFMPLLNKKGASSVLIILMMIVLVVFGLAALTTSMAAMRLTEKSTDWTGEYYSLEKEAGEFLFEIDSILYDAEIRAIAYIEDGLYLNNGSTLFPEDTQEMIFNTYNNTIPKSARPDYLSRVMEAAFYQSALSQLLNEYPGATYEYNGSFLRWILEDEGHPDITFGTTVSENGTEFAKNLDIKLKLLAPKYYIDFKNGKVTGERSAASLKRYDILAWKEWQEYFDYSDKIEFDDAFDQSP